jgi:hypothetical protein
VFDVSPYSVILSPPSCYIRHFFTHRWGGRRERQLRFPKKKGISSTQTGRKPACYPKLLIENVLNQLVYWAVKFG